jgi:hypothetical protein
MDGKRSRFVESVDGRRTIPERRPSALLHRGWAAALGVGWPLAFLVMVELEPAPAQPDAAPVLGIILSLALLTGLMLTAVAAGTRQLLAAPAAVGTGVVALTMSVACPVSGHHSYGAWWYAQMAIVVAMLGVSVLALGSRART